MKEAGKMILCLGFGLAVGYLVSRWVVPIAYAERGYEAFGGEWIFIFAAGWAGCLGMYRLWRCK